MRRSEALAILSRDHHHALVEAQKLKRAGPDTVTDTRAGFLEFWAGEGSLHFRLEEEMLLPAYAAYGDARHPLVLQVLGDHVEIRALTDRLARRTEVEPEVLHELGAALSTHVRLEERQLFPIIEEAMPADELLVLARALEQAEAEDPS